jgi:hypothetical protein
MTTFGLVLIKWAAVDIGFGSVVVCCYPCVPHGLSLVVIIYALEHSLLTSQFLRVSYTQGLYQNQTACHKFELERGQPIGWIKIIMNEWSPQKRKGYYWINGDRVGRRGCCLLAWWYVTILESYIGLSLILTICI